MTSKVQQETVSCVLNSVCKVSATVVTGGRLWCVMMRGGGDREGGSVHLVRPASSQQVEQRDVSKNGNGCLELQS